MMSNFIKNLLLLVFFVYGFIYQSNSAYGMNIDTEMETTFFNVGQGNCTVVGYKKLPEEINKSHVLLVDAGSSEYDDKRAGRSDTEQKQEISKKIKCFFHEIKEKQLTIILSHGDKDHYSWVFDILDNLSLEEDEIKFICGGKKTDYGKANGPFQNSLIPYVNANRTLFTADLKKEDSPKLDFSPGKCTFFCPIRNAKEKNDNSIILKIKYAGKSLLLTGDATDKTTQALKQYDVIQLASEEEVTKLKSKQLGVFQKEGKLYCRTHKKEQLEIFKDEDPNKGIKPDIFQRFLKNEKLKLGDKVAIRHFTVLNEYVKKITVIQLTHHGASEKCNSKNFIEDFSLQACVISAGIHGGYLHPKQTVIETVSQRLPMIQQEEGKKYHTVRYYNDGEFPITNLGKITPLGIPNFFPLGICAYPQKEFGYNLARTSLMLFTTSTNGNITFSFKKGEEKSSLAYPKIEFDNITTFEDLQRILKKYSPQLTSLNLSNMKLDDKTLEQLSKVLPTNLISLNLKENDISSFELIEKIVNKTTSIKEINLYKNKIAEEKLGKIKEILGIRGLILHETPNWN